jgi:phage repressor protein C with HTH and peptisase S24 domain
MAEISGGTLGDRIRLARHSVPREAAALRLGVSDQSLGRYERNERVPDAEVLAGIVREFRADALWLLTGAPPGTAFTSPPHSDEDTSAMATAGRSGHMIVGPSQLAGEGFVLLPRYDVRAAAGAGAVVGTEQIIDFLAFKYEWIKRVIGIEPRDLGLISAEGDSMHPTIRDGDLLLLDLTVKRVRDNAIYALRIDDSLSVKRIQKRTNGALKIISDNSIYEPEEIDPRRSAELQIVGRVVWHGGMV